MASSCRTVAAPGAWRRFRSLWLCSCALPPLALGAAVSANVGIEGWLSTPLPILRALVADATLYCATLLVATAPLAGVAAGSRRTGSGSSGMAAAVDTAWPLVVAVLLLAIAMSASTLAVGRFNASAVCTTAAVALALALVGACCARAVTDPLDAVACSLGGAVIASVGLLVVGPVVDRIPAPILDLALTVNPFIAMTSAGGIDILRTDVLYRISPLAHLHVEYPAWHVAAAWHLLLAVAAFCGLMWHRADRAPTAPRKDVA
jgi:hypothetical protein